MGGYFLIVGLAALTTAMTALFCSTLFRKSSTSLMCSYFLIATLFLAPVAASVFTENFLAQSSAGEFVSMLEIVSPFSAAFNLPLNFTEASNLRNVNVGVFWGYLGFTALYNGALLAAMMWLFNVRWRVSE
jgi:hypothetical protein